MCSSLEVDAVDLGWTIGPDRVSVEDGSVGSVFADFGNDDVAGYRLAMGEAVLANFDDDEPILKISRRR